MKAMVVARNGGVATIEQQDIEEPVRKDGQVLIEVQAASVNRADLAVLSGTHVASGVDAGPTVVGLDAAGTIVESDPSSDLKIGDRVMTMVGGGLAEKVAVDSGMVVPMPGSWTFEEGAGAILALMTSHNALKTAGRCQSGDSVMINAAQSGVGQMAIKVARHLGAEQILAGVRTKKANAFLAQIGADVVIDTSSSTFADEVLEVTGGNGVDITIDHVGGPYLGEHVRGAALKGRIVGVGRLGGPEGVLDLEALALKRLEIVGVTFRTRDAAEKTELVRLMCADLLAGTESDELKPHIDRVLPWTEVLTAQEAVASDAHLGKIILQVGA